MNGADNMETRLQKWGNSDGIRIPSSFLKTLDLKTNDVVELIQEEDKIIILKQKKHLTLEERFNLFEKLPKSEKGLVEPYDWGIDLEREIFD